ncbi:hypothetical protein AQUCO_02600029v1 [Aquilegia coerulea]|uniref:Hyccin n=1 Tax=Aquilegia coerulea TaxID=218851 RepID=A0A2G5D708_AQUCA|nr:hypothetical protein AQUCO_02600029v1 [Aquilegia coerulea]
MEIQLNQILGSPSSSSSDPNPNSNSNPNSMQSWWEAISKARSRIQALSVILSSSPSISALADSDHPARSLLQSQETYLAVSSSLSQPLSGSGDDPLCQWLYETFQSYDPDLRLVVLSFIPLLTGLYLSRIITPSVENPQPSLSGFEAVILSLYASETKVRGGKPILITIPDLSQPSLYHSPRTKTSQAYVQAKPSVGVLCPPLEPQVAVKSTKRAFIVSVALDCYYKQISQMPSWSKLDLCQFAAVWAGQNCSCRSEFDVDNDVWRDGNGKVCEIRDFAEDNEIEDAVEEMRKLGFGEEHMENGGSRGVRIPLPWELLQPVLRILGHCLFAPLNSQDVRDAAAYAVRCLYARASHDLVPQAILATRSLIQLDRRSRLAAKAAAAANAASNANTPSKARKPEVLLVSK